MAEPDIHNMQEFTAAVNRLRDDWLNIDYLPFLATLTEDLEQLHDNYFQSETGPAGSRWPQLAPSTIARKGHDEILVDTGRLRRSLVGRTADSVREAFQEEGHAWVHFGTDVEYSHFHDEESRRPRPHVGLSEPDLNGIAGQVLDYQVNYLVAQAE